MFLETLVTKKRILLIIGLVSSFWVTVYMVKSIAEVAQSTAVVTAIKAQWEKPNKPIDVPVVVVSGQHAIADWIQGEKGGRALLMMHGRHWQTMMCGDGNMKQRKHLLQAGVPAKDADALIAGLGKAEAKLTSDQLKLIDSFKGMVDLLKEPHHHD